MANCRVKRHVSVALLLLWLFSSDLYLAKSVWAEKFQVMQEKDHSCYDVSLPCMTLSQYAAKSDNYFGPNATLALEPGMHSLDIEFQVSNMAQVAILGNGNFTVISCTSQAKFVFNNIDSVYMSRLTFSNCVGNIVAFVSKSTLERCSLNNQQNCKTLFKLDMIRSVNICKSSLTISDTGAITCDFNKEDVAFTIKSCSNVSLSDVSLKDIKARSNSIVNVLKSTVIFNRCLLTNNTLSMANGVVIISNSYIEVYDTKFENNNVTCLGTCSTVRTANSSTILKRNRFINNKVSFPEFNDNSVALNQAGAALSFDTGSIVVIFNNTFQNNTAGTGAVSIKGGTISLYYCTFMTNEATALYGGMGGALRVENTKTQLTDCAFHTNMAKYGGALYVIGGDTELIIENCSFHGNAAIMSGGAVYAYKATVSVFNSKFILNRAIHVETFSFQSPKNISVSYSAHGGAFGAVESNLTIIESKFINNSAITLLVVELHNCDDDSTSKEFGVVSNLKAYGGALYVLHSTTIVDDSVFLCNSVCTDITSNHDNCLWFNNAEAFGGAVVSHSGRITITTSHFMMNDVKLGKTVALNAGSYESYNGSFEINPTTNKPLYGVLNGTTDGSSASGYAVTIAYSISAVINGSVFLNNSAPTEGVGGTLHIFNSYIIQVLNCSFSKNSAGTSYRQSQFHTNENCTAKADDGSFVSAIQALFSSILIIDGCDFIENAAIPGGTIKIQETNYVKISNCDFVGNTAESDLSGTVFVLISSALIINSMFLNNTGSTVSVMQAKNYPVRLESCKFLNNLADTGGSAVRVFNSENISLNNIAFTNNSKLRSEGPPEFLKCILYPVFSPYLGAINYGRYYFGDYGSALYALNSNVKINSCEMNQNTHRAVFSLYSTLVLRSLTFSNNLGVNGGAVMVAYSTLKASNSIFLNNTCTLFSCSGAALSTYGSKTNLVNNTFWNNTAYAASAVDVSLGTLVMDNCTFVSNTALSEGAAIYVDSSKLFSNSLNIQHNVASSIIFAVNSTLNCTGNTTMSHNSGSLFALYSNVTFLGHTSIYANVHTTSNLQQYRNENRGTVTAFHSDISFSGTILLMYNNAITGGAILARESKIHFYGATTIALNTAILDGGGLYTSQSELNFMGSVKITNNVAGVKGGGIHSVATTMRLKRGSLLFVDNKAKYGGGVSFEMNSKLYVFKISSECLQYDTLCMNTDYQKWLTLYFVSNVAEYGGAFYVNDEENTGTCATNSSNINDCFFQALAVYEGHLYQNIRLNLRNTFFF